MLNTAVLELLTSTVVGIVEINHRAQFEGDWLAELVPHDPPELVTFKLRTPALNEVTEPIMKFCLFPVSDTFTVCPAVNESEVPTCAEIAVMVFAPEPIVSVEEL